MSRGSRTPRGGRLAPVAAGRVQASGGNPPHGGRASRSHPFYPDAGQAASAGAELLFRGTDPAKRGRFLRLLRTGDGYAAGALWSTADGIVYRRILDAKRHTVWSPEASWAFDVACILQAKAEGARIVEIVDGGTGRTWRCDFDRLTFGAELMDRGHGEQLRWPVMAFDGPPLAVGTPIVKRTQQSLFHHTEGGQAGEGER